MVIESTNYAQSLEHNNDSRSTYL